MSSRPRRFGNLFGRRSARKAARRRVSKRGVSRQSHLHRFSPAESLERRAMLAVDVGFEIDASHFFDELIDNRVPDANGLLAGTIVRNYQASENDGALVINLTDNNDTAYFSIQGGLYSVFHAAPAGVQDRLSFIDNAGDFIGLLPFGNAADPFGVAYYDFVGIGLDQRLTGLSSPDLYGGTEVAPSATFRVRALTQSTETWVAGARVSSQGTGYENWEVSLLLGGGIRVRSAAGVTAPAFYTSTQPEDITVPLDVDFSNAADWDAVDGGAEIRIGVPVASPEGISLNAATIDITGRMQADGAVSLTARAGDSADASASDGTGLIIRNDVLAGAALDVFVDGVNLDIRSGGSLTAAGSHSLLMRDGSAYVGGDITAADHEIFLLPSLGARNAVASRTINSFRQNGNGEVASGTFVGDQVFLSLANDTNDKDGVVDILTDVDTVRINAGFADSAFDYDIAVTNQGDLLLETDISTDGDVAYATEGAGATINLQYAMDIAGSISLSAAGPLNVTRSLVSGTSVLLESRDNDVTVLADVGVTDGGGLVEIVAETGAVSIEATVTGGTGVNITSGGAVTSAPGGFVTVVDPQDEVIQIRAGGDVDVATGIGVIDVQGQSVAILDTRQAWVEEEDGTVFRNELEVLASATGSIAITADQSIVTEDLRAVDQVDGAGVTVVEGDVFLTTNEGVIVLDGTIVASGNRLVLSAEGGGRDGDGELLTDGDYTSGDIKLVILDDAYPEVAEVDFVAQQITEDFVGFVATRQTIAATLLGLEADFEIADAPGAVTITRAVTVDGAVSITAAGDISASGVAAGNDSNIELISTGGRVIVGDVAVVAVDPDGVVIGGSAGAVTVSAAIGIEADPTATTHLVANDITLSAAGAGGLASIGSAASPLKLAGVGIDDRISVAVVQDADNMDDPGVAQEIHLETSHDTDLVSAIVSDVLSVKAFNAAGVVDLSASSVTATAAVDAKIELSATGDLTVATIGARQWVGTAETFDDLNKAYRGENGDLFLVNADGNVYSWDNGGGFASSVAGVVGRVFDYPGAAGVQRVADEGTGIIWSWDSGVGFDRSVSTADIVAAGEADAAAYRAGAGLYYSGDFAGNVVFQAANDADGNGVGDIWTWDNGGGYVDQVADANARPFSYVGEDGDRVLQEDTGAIWRYNNGVGYKAGLVYDDEVTLLADLDYLVDPGVVIPDTVPAVGDNALEDGTGNIWKYQVVEAGGVTEADPYTVAYGSDGDANADILNRAVGTRALFTHKSEGLGTNRAEIFVLGVTAGDDFTTAFANQAAADADLDHADQTVAVLVDTRDIVVLGTSDGAGFDERFAANGVATAFDYSAAAGDRALDTATGIVYEFDDSGLGGVATVADLPANGTPGELYVVNGLALDVGGGRFGAPVYEWVGGDWVATGGSVIWTPNIFDQEIADTASFDYAAQTNDRVFVTSGTYYQFNDNNNAVDGSVPTVAALTDPLDAGYIGAANDIDGERYVVNGLGADVGAGNFEAPIWQKIGGTWVNLVTGEDSDGNAVSGVVPDPTEVRSWNVSATVTAAWTATGEQAEWTDTTDSAGWGATAVGAVTWTDTGDVTAWTDVGDAADTGWTQTDDQTEWADPKPAVDLMGENSSISLTAGGYLVNGELGGTTSQLFAENLRLSAKSFNADGTDGFFAVDRLDEAATIVVEATGATGIIDLAFDRDVDLELTKVSTVGGGITIVNDGDGAFLIGPQGVTAGGPTSGISLTATGEIAGVADGAGSLTAASVVLDSGAAIDVQTVAPNGGTMSLTATAAAEMTVAHQGNVRISDVGDDVGLDATDIELSVAGDLAISAAGLIKTGTLLLDVVGGSAAIRTDLTSIRATIAGDFSITETDDDSEDGLTLAGDAFGNGGITATGDVSIVLEAGSLNGAGLRVTGREVAMILESTGSLDIKTNATSLVASTADGAITISNLGDFAVGEDGIVALIDTGDPNDVAGHVVSLASETGAIRNVNGGTIFAEELSLEAVTGIDVLTDVDQILSASTVSGGVAIEQDSGKPLEVDSIEAAGGDVRISQSGGDLTLIGVIDARGVGADVAIETLGADGAAGYSVVFDAGRIDAVGDVSIVAAGGITGESLGYDFDRATGADITARGDVTLAGATDEVVATVEAARVIATTAGTANDITLTLVGSRPVFIGSSGGAATQLSATGSISFTAVNGSRLDADGDFLGNDIFVRDLPTFGDDLLWDTRGAVVYAVSSTGNSGTGSLTTVLDTAGEFTNDNADGTTIIGFDAAIRTPLQLTRQVTIDGPVVLDGTRRVNVNAGTFSFGRMVDIDGSRLGGGDTIGIRLAGGADESRIAGLAFYGFNGTNGAAIEIDGANDVTIENASFGMNSLGRVFSNTGGIIVSDGDNTQILRNTIVRSSGAGIELGAGVGGDTVVAENLIGTNARRRNYGNEVGIRVLAGADGVEIRDNLIAFNADQGIHATGATNFVLGDNEVTRNGSGITIDGASNEVLLVGNSLTRNDGNGITVAGTSRSVTIGGTDLGEANLIGTNERGRRGLGNRSNGVEIDTNQSDVVIVSNSIMNNGSRRNREDSSGIKLSKGNGVEISGNAISGNREHGIVALAGVTASIVKNEVFRNYLSGIDASAAGALAIGSAIATDANSFTSNRRFGAVAGNSTNVGINLFSGNRRGGIENTNLDNISISNATLNAENDLVVNSDNFQNGDVVNVYVSKGSRSRSQGATFIGSVTIANGATSVELASLSSALRVRVGTSITLTVTRGGQTSEFASSYRVRRA
jgi:hypothetical protein